MARTTPRRTTPRRTTPPPGSSTFCYRVKHWRACQGVTQRRFAELWGVSPSLVQKIEADDYRVSQLSFERLEALRTLVQLPSETFYNLIGTHPGAPLGCTAKNAEAEYVKVARLEPGFPPVSLSRTLLGHAAESQLGAFTVAPSDFASDRLRSSLNIGTLVIFDRASAVREGEAGVSVAQSGLACRILTDASSGVQVLRSFDPENSAALELYPDDLEPLGVVVAY